MSNYLIQFLKKNLNAPEPLYKDIDRFSGRGGGGIFSLYFQDGPGFADGSSLQLCTRTLIVFREGGGGHFFSIFSGRSGLCGRK